MLFEKGNKLSKGNSVLVGKRAFERHGNGQKIRPDEAIKAKCYDCMGFYEDGRLDCTCGLCPLYFWMPYRMKK